MKETNYNYAFVVQPKKNKNKKTQINKNGIVVERWYCGRSAPIKVDCSKRRRDKVKHDVNKNMEKHEKAIVAFEESYKPPTNCTLAACHKEFIDSGATVHMMKYLSVITGKAIPFDISIATTGKDTIKVTTQCESVINMTGGMNPVTLNHVLHAPKATHRLISVSS